MSERDRISELPESLLTQILSYLPTEQSVKTSVLSKRWENLWLSVPVLDLDCFRIRYDADEVFLRSMDKLLEFRPESSLLKVKVKCRGTMIDGFMDRLGTMISRGTQHLDVESSTYYIDDHSLGVTLPCVDFMPVSLLTSRTLVYLKLFSSGLADPPGSVFMPCLKFMHLEEVKFRVHLEKVLSGCPVLEELTLVRDLDDDYGDRNDGFEVMRVRSQSLKRFSVPPRTQRWHYSTRVKCTLEIDAPGLEYMSVGEDQFDSIIVVKNLTSLLVVDLDIRFALGFGLFIKPYNLAKRTEIDGFLNGISSVRHMIISAKTVQAFDRYSKVGKITKFSNLSRLEAVFYSFLLEFLPAFLECCPNLKHLVLLVVHSEETEEEGLELADVPRCVSSSLECVEIQEKLELEEGKMKATSYFLGNSAVLKKFILSHTAYEPRYVMESEIWEKVNKLTKRSAGCEIIIR